MNVNKIYKNFKNLTIFGFTACLVSCAADSIIPDAPIPNAPVEEIKKANCFIAFNIYVEDDSKTRAPFDADKEDADSFNKGMPYERALYKPAANPSQGDEEENPSDATEVVASSNASEPHLYHFALLFKEDGYLDKPDLLPLIWDEENDEDDPYATLYTKLYDNDVEGMESPYEKEFKGTVLVVLNASYDLEQQVRDRMAESGTLYSIRDLVVTSSANNDERDNYLYLKDNNGEFILDEEGHRFLTMSSSMIIDGNTVKPAITGDFKFYSTDEEALAHPTSLYVERLQAKYTVVFKTFNGYSIGTDNQMSNPAVGSLYYMATGNLNSTSSSNFHPTNRLIISPCGVDASGELVQGSTPKALKYVTSYQRSTSIGERNNVEVHTTTDWKINIIGWGINGVEEKEYLFKKLTPAAAYASELWFKSSPNVRNFWAEGPHYREGVYPDQYREARYMPKHNEAGERNNIYDIKEDVLHAEYLEDLTDGADHTKGWVEPTLKYFSFNELSRKDVRTYLPEHTFNVESFKERESYENKAHLRHGSHLIVTAQLLIKGENGAPFEPSNIYDANFFDPADGTVVSSFYRVRSKYYMNDIFWEEAAYKNYVIEYLGYWMLTDENKKIFGNNNGIFYVNDEGAVAESGDFIIEQAHIEGGDGMVWVKPATGVTLYSFNPDLEDNPETTDIDERYVSIDPEDYRALAYEHQNYMAQCFNEGRMYYSSGTPHANTVVRSITPKTGDYGTVRNNWYYFTVDGISAPGTPVSDFNQPIIPNNEPNETALGVSIQLMDWRLIDEDVKVEGQHRPNED